MSKIEVYKCDFCKKILRTQKGIESHEKQCLYNPNGANCYLCEHACISDVYVDHYGGEHLLKDHPYCKIKDDGIFENEAADCEDYKNCGKTMYDRAECSIKETCDDVCTSNPQKCGDETEDKE